MKIQKHALLIGAMGGLGSATVKQLSNDGWHVFAADIQEDVFTFYGNINNITPLRLDITNNESVGQAYQMISGQTSHLDAVIHMAGILKIGSVAELPVSDLEKALDVNLLGIYRVNKQFLPLLLQRKGRIIILSSEVGRQTAAPFNGIYSISKHALEAYSDALRRELAFLGIKVIKIQPGPIKTSMTENAEQLFTEADKSSTYFKKNLAKGISYLPRVYKQAGDPVIVAKAILKALESSRPKTAYLVRPDKKRMLIGLLPARWSDNLIKWILSK
jgi:NAD(P)-dependent dehydrogenase (short-subunit alcohol dehydrogenase family)